MNQQIEVRLQDALRSEAEMLQLSSDPWQENQRRVAGAASGRSRKLLTVAAAGLAVATVLGATALWGGDAGRQRGDSPASGAGDPFTPEYLLGAPVEAEMLTIDGRPTVHTIALSDMTGDGPRLCGRYSPAGTTGASGPSGLSGAEISSSTCTSREPDADDDSVAIDWLVGNMGGGDIRGVTAGVDERVAKVRIWMDNGDMMLATLYPTGWDDTRMFALTTQPPGAPTAQRLVAYGRDGNVLQAVDLTHRLGQSWLAGNSACSGGEIAQKVAEDDVGPAVDVALGASDAQISILWPNDGRADVCLERLRPAGFAGWHSADALVVLVTAPEVERVLVYDGRRDVAVADITPEAVSGSLFRVADAVVEGLSEQASVVAFDSSGQELDRQLLAESSAPDVRN